MNVYRLTYQMYQRIQTQIQKEEEENQLTQKTQPAQMIKSLTMMATVWIQT